MSKIAKSIAVLGVVAGLGVAALPMSSYAAESAPVTIQAIVDSSIAVTADTNMVNLGTIGAGTGVATQTAQITVSGSVSKYNLTVNATNADAALEWTKEAEGQGADETAQTETKIPAVDDLNNNTVTKGWALMGGEIADWKAVPGSGAAGLGIVNAAPLSTTGEGGAVVRGTATTNVSFGVKADGTLKNGIYQGQVVFTATTN